MRRVPIGAWVLLTLLVATLACGVAVAAAPSASSADAADSGRYAGAVQSDDSWHRVGPVRPTRSSDALADSRNSSNATTVTDNADAQDTDDSDVRENQTHSQDNETASLDPDAAAARREAVADGERLVESCAAVPPADHAPPADGDAVGWVNGYWYDEPLHFDDSASLDAAELDALTARTAARVEALRCLDFEAVPRVRVANGSELSARQTAAIENRSGAASQFDDARLEASLLLGTDVDPGDARIELSGTAVRGSYDPTTGAITLVAAEANETQVDEPTLAHELVHALQDQHHDLSSFDARRTDEAQAESALIEGDARVVEQRYEQRCEDGQWVDPCRSAPSSDGGDGSVALSLLRYQPYNDGPVLVERAYDEGGWAAVDASYDDPPQTAAETFSPSSYESYDPPFVPIAESGSPAWDRIRPDDAPANDVLGPSAIAAALLAPTFEGHPDPIYDPETIQRNTRQLDDSYRTYDYRLDVVDGWVGDRLVAYENARRQTGAIWASQWQSTEDARTFRDQYEELLDVRGARPVDGHRDTYRFRETSDYDGAAYVAREGTDVVIVHGPDVAALQSLYAGAAPEPRGSVASSGAQPGPSSELPTTESLPGLQIGGALVALVLVAGAAFGWRRRS